MLISDIYHSLYPLSVTALVPLFYALRTFIFYYYRHYYYYFTTTNFTYVTSTTTIRSMIEIIILTSFRMFSPYLSMVLVLIMTWALLNELYIIAMCV